MKLSTLALATIIVGLFASGVSFAAEKAIMLLEGKAPARVAYIADFLRVSDRTPLTAVTDAKKPEDIERLGRERKQVMMHVLAVYEAKDQPESVDMTVEFQCHPKNYAITAAHAIYRDLSVANPVQDWKPIASSESPWPATAAFIACENKSVREAAEKMAKSPGGKDSSALEKLRLIYIGDLIHAQAIDTIWSKVWTDSVRPPYTAKKRTAEERKADMDRMEKEAASAIAQISNAAAGANAEIQNMEAESKFQTLIASNVKKHPQKIYKQLNWLLGRSESEVVRLAGAPLNVTQAGDARFLTYYNEYHLQGVGHTVGPDGAPTAVSGTTVTCELTVEFRRGGSKPEFRAVGFERKAGNGGCIEFSWFNDKAAKNMAANPPAVSSNPSSAELPASESAKTSDVRERRWGALAYDKRKLVVDYMKSKYIGLSNNEKSKLDAQTVALAECKKDGGENCEVIETYANACLTLSTGEGGLKFAVDQDKRKAGEMSLQACSREFAACKIIYAACASPN